MPKPKPETYIKQTYEVQTSSVGVPGTWYRNKSFDPTPTGRKEALTHLSKEANHSRHVRLAKVVKTSTVEKQLLNGAIASPDQIATLLAKGKAALVNVPGIKVNEGMMVGFGSNEGMAFGPVRVSVSFHVGDLLGKRPPLNKMHPDSVAACISYDIQALFLMRKALDDSAALLKAAGISFRRYTHEIVLNF